MNQGSNVCRFLIPVIASCLFILPGVSGGSDGDSAPALECPPCDDGNACTSDTCDPATGTCGHAPIVCDDSNLCTTDSCDPATGCAFNPAPAGTPCDDGRTCTMEDVCDDNGRCAGTPEPPGKGCDDGNSCTLADACDGGGACAGIPQTPGSPCDDGQACTTGDLCVQDPSGGVICRGTPRACDDGNLCTNDACDPATGNCSFRPIDCDDGKACTQDSCFNGFCQHFPFNPPCDDHNACTLNDRYDCGPNGELVCRGGTPRFCEDHDCFTESCDPARGCVYTYRCDDNNPCTADFCQVNCNHLPVLGVSCDDGDACTTGDACVYAGGIFPTCRGVSRCDDGNPCTDDRCDPTAPDGCAHTNNTAFCSDGDGCTILDACRDGVCQPGHPKFCSDGNSCTIDSCDPASGACGHVPVVGVTCDDDNACTAGEVCERPGVCSGAYIDCDDGNTCTIDSCDAASGCTHVLDSNPPDDEGDGVTDSCDNCPGVFNPRQDDCNGNGVGDVCDPSLYDLRISTNNAIGKGAGVVSWTTACESDLFGFNVLRIDNQGRVTLLNPVLIGCNECVTGKSSSYLLPIPKHRGARDVYLEVLYRNALRLTVGPAVKE